MRLYELTNDLKVLEEQIELLNTQDDTESELMIADIETIKDTIKNLIEAKSEGIVAIMRNWDSDIDSIDSEIDRLKDLKVRITNKKEKLREYTLNCLEESGIKKIETSLGNVSVRKGTGLVNITDYNSIDDKYIEIVTTKKYDKTAIKNDIKNGIEVAGAELIIKNSLVVPRIKKGDDK